MKKRLFLINVSLNKGSTGRIAEQIGELAKNKDFEVYYAHGSRYVGRSIHKSIKIGNKWNEYIHAGIYDKLLGIDGLGSTKSTKKLIKTIESIRPDIIHLHNIHGYFLNFKILFEYLNKKEIPVIWTLHDCWSFTGGCSYLNSSKCKKWTIYCKDCPLRKGLDNSNIIFHIKKNLFTKNQNLTLIPVSYWLNSLLKESFMKTTPSCVIHNGTDLNVFQPMGINAYLIDQYHLRGKYIILGVAAPWSTRKGLNDFIQLATFLPEKYKIVLIGLNDAQIQKLPSNIIGIKRTENINELAQWYSLANVFVNPTYSDNFPTTNIEALACGTPVITYQTGGSPEAIDTNTGLVIEQGNLNELLNAIEKICSNEKNEYIKSCRHRAESLFNKEDRFKEYIDLYNQILQR